MKFLLRLIALLILSGSGTAQAWNIDDHRVLSRLALEKVSTEWGLDVPCEVHPLQAFLDKLKPIREELGDAWHLASYLQVNPAIDIGQIQPYRFPNEKLGGRTTMTPFEVLASYAGDPDDGRDQDLFVRDDKGNPNPVYADQKWFGAIQGSKSQAFRHIEKPPFNLFHPVATFGFPLRHLGEASQRVEIYFQLSRLAFLLGEDYWGWRFLADSFHYLEDLHNPYHAGQLTPTLFLKGLRALRWGWKENGFIGSIAVVVSNSHRFFESYVATPGGRDEGSKAKALEALSGSDLIPFPGSMEVLSHNVRDDSNRLLGELTHSVAVITDPHLDGPYEFRSDEDNPDDPQAFLTEGPNFDTANRRIFEIVKDRFASAGRALRTEVKAMMDLRQTDASTSPAQILEQLDKLIGPSPFMATDETTP